MLIKTSIIFQLLDEEVKGVKDLPIVPQGRLSNFPIKLFSY